MGVKNKQQNKAEYNDAMYQAALQHFNKAFQEPGFTIENDYVREHKEELCYCFEHDKTLLDFDWWCRYEDLLKIQISYEEYHLLDQSIDDDPMDIDLEDTNAIAALQKQLQILRGESIKETAREEPALDEKIQNAEQKNIKKEIMSDEALFQAVYDKFTESNKAFEEELSSMQFEELKPYLTEYVLRTEMLRVLEENLSSHELSSADCYALLHSTYTLGSIVEKFHELKHVDELDQEFRLDLLNAFEECANERIHMVSEIEKNIKERG